MRAAPMSAAKRSAFATTATCLVLAFAALSPAATATSRAASGSSPEDLAHAAASHSGWGHDMVPRAATEPATPTLRTLTTTSSSGLRATPRSRLAADPSITYDVFVFGVAAPQGATPANVSNSAAIISHLDRAYAAATRGTYKFNFGAFHTLPAFAGDTCDTPALDHRYRPQIDSIIHDEQPANPALWIISTAYKDECSFHGRASLGGAGLYMNGHWEPGPDITSAPTPITDDLAARSYGQSTPLSSITLLAHEIGHNLGLSHANATSYTGTPGDPFATTPEEQEYGDPTDTMGSSYFTDLQFNTFNLWQLGVLDSVEIAAATAERTSVALTRADASTPGVRMVVIPAGDDTAYLIDHRRARSGDWPLAYAGGYHWASSGVFVRAIDTRTTWFARSMALLPYRDVVLNDPEQSLVDFHTHRSGLRTGEEMRLPGDITVRVESTTADVAQVTVTRPRDTRMTAAAPDPCAGHIFISTTSCAADPSLYHPGSAGYSLSPRLRSDDTWTRYFDVHVDGQRVRRFDLGTPNADWGTIRHHNGALNDFTAENSLVVTLPAGEHHIRYVLTDLAGNTADNSATVVVGDSDTSFAAPRTVTVRALRDRRAKVTVDTPTVANVRSIELQVSVNRRAFTRVATLGAAASVAYRSPSLKSGALVRWRARTVGVDGSTSKWVASSSITVR